MQAILDQARVEEEEEETAVVAGVVGGVAEDQATGAGEGLKKDVGESRAEARVPMTGSTSGAQTVAYVAVPSRRSGQKRPLELKRSEGSEGGKGPTRAKKDGKGWLGKCKQLEKNYVLMVF
jgi:hypothetical protein